MIGDTSAFSSPRPSAPKKTSFGQRLSSRTGGTLTGTARNTTTDVGPVPLTGGGTGVSPTGSPTDTWQNLQGMAGHTPQENPYTPLLGPLGTYQQLQQQHAQQSAGLNQQSLGYQLAGVGVDQAANQQELGIISQLQGLAGQDYKNTLAGFGIDRTEAGQRRDRDWRMERNESAAAGSTLFPGHRQDMADIGSSYDNTVGRIGLGETGAGISHQQTLLGLDRQKLSNATSQQKLDIMAQQLGIDAQQLQVGLQDTLNQLGWNGAQQLGSLLDQIGSHDQQQAAEALQALQWMYEMYPYMPQQQPGPLPQSPSAVPIPATPTYGGRNG